MSESVDRVEATVRAWKAKLQREQQSHAKRDDVPIADPIAALQQTMQVLEADLADVLSMSETVGRRAGDLETRAMEAIRGGNEVTARRLLLGQQECAETLEQLDADAKVIRAMLAECRSVLPE